MSILRSIGLRSTGLRSFGLPAMGSCALFALTATSALAETPRVVTDVAPVHGLVARIMGDLGEPTLLVPANQSPHHANLRPSQARALARAELVVWMGPALTPWLENSVEALASEVGHIELLSVEGTLLLPSRSLADIAGLHDDHEDHDGHDDHDEHEAHDDHDGHDDHEAHDDHEEHAGHHDHDHGDTDPHAWLDPDNAVYWTGIIAEALIRLDPENAATYEQNAEDAVAEIEEMEADVRAALRPHHDTAFLVRHDAYQYFEEAFDISATGALTLSDEQAPSAGQLAELREHVQELGPICVFAELEASARMVNGLLEGMDIHVATADQLGAKIEPGPAFYTTLMRDLGNDFSACLDEH